MGFQGLDRKWILAVTVAAFAVSAVGYYSLVFSPSSGKVTGIVWHRSGGFAGLDEELTVESDGSVVLSSNFMGEMEFTLSEVELNGLFSIIEEADIKGYDDSYGPRSGVADFFSYRLIVETGTSSKQIDWVDGWASEKKLPGGLEEIADHVLSIIHGEGPGAIEGTVRDEGEEPVAGLVVSIVNGSVGFPEIAAMTDDGGFYQIGGVPPGVFQVGVHDELGERIGLEAVVVRGGETSVVDFTVSAREVQENFSITSGTQQTGEETTEAPEPDFGMYEGIIVGQVAKNFTLAGLDGQSFSLSDHRGEVVLIEFMTTWCGFCKLQHGELEALYAEVENVTLVTVEIDVTLKEEAFMDWALGQEYGWFVGHSPALGWEYQVMGVPTVLVVDKEGIIQYRGFYTKSSKLQSIIQQHQ